MIYAVIDTNVLVSALLSRHSDAATVQVVKAVYINGAPQGITFHKTENIRFILHRLSRLIKTDTLSTISSVTSVLLQELVQVRSTMSMVRTVASLPPDNRITLSV